MSVMCLLPFSCSLEEETRTEVEKKNYMNNAEEAKDDTRLNSSHT